MPTIRQPAHLEEHPHTKAHRLTVGQVVARLVVVAVITVPIGAGTAWLLFGAGLGPLALIGVAAAVPAAMAATTVTITHYVDRHERRPR